MITAEAAETLGDSFKVDLETANPSLYFLGREQAWLIGGAANYRRWEKMVAGWCFNTISNGQQWPKVAALPLNTATRPSQGQLGLKPQSPTSVGLGNGHR